MKWLAIAAVIIVACIVVVLVVMLSGSDKTPDLTAIRLSLNDDTTVMKVGTSRVIDVFFFSGNDDRTKDNYRGATQKSIEWNI